MNNKILDAALTYAQHGFAVFPIRREDKKAYIKDWTNAASTDPEQIKAWWGQFPMANVAVALGEKSNNVIAIDLDKHSDEQDGGEFLRDWQYRNHIKFPDTRINLTGSGGHHLLFRVPNPSQFTGVTNYDPDRGGVKTEEYLTGIDIRSTGNCIVVPPSIHENGKEYAWDICTEELPIADADENVLRFLEKARKDDSDKPKKTFFPPEQILGGERNTVLFRMACSMQSEGYPDSVIDAAVREANRTITKPPLDDRELQKTIESALRYGKGTRILSPSYPTLEAKSDCLREDSLIEWMKQKDVRKWYQYSDIGGSRLIADALEKKAIYNATTKGWMFYDGKRWVTEEGELKTKAAVKTVARALMKYAAATMPPEEEKDPLLFWATKWSDARKRNTLLQDAASNHFASQTEFDRDDYALNTQTGVLHLKDGIRFEEHSPDQMLSNMANVEYKPDATCPRWESFISEVMEGNTEKMRYLQKLAGLCLTGERRFEEAYFFHGRTTRNGKSTMVETLAAILGDYATSINSESLAKKSNPDSKQASPDIAKLQGKRLVICPEPDKGMRLNTALVKTLTGNDSITARHLHQEEISYTPRFKLILTCNHLPEANDPTLFTSDRVQVITFDKHFTREERDTTLKAHFLEKESRSGILNWCLEGWKMYQLEGLEPPACINSATADYADESDQLGQFLSDCFVPFEGGRMSIKEAYNRFCKWAEDSGTRGLSKSDFISDVKTAGYFKPTATIASKTVRNVLIGWELKSSN